MDKKIIIGSLVVMVAIIWGGIVFSGTGSSSSDATQNSLQKTEGAKIEIKETNFDFKDVKYSGGNVKHGYKIKNIGTKDLKIGNLATSCMCTKVFLQAKSFKSPEFGMKGHQAGEPWIGTLKPGEEAEMVADFDPTAHGPEGVGPISRLISFETNDPDKPYVEFSFSGNVVK